MSSLGLNWSLAQGGGTEHHKSPHTGMYDHMSGTHSPSVAGQEHANSSQSKKRAAAAAYQSNDYYHYPGQQSGLLPGSNPLLHHTADLASARLR